MSMTMRILGGVACASGLNLWCKFKDHVDGVDPFSKHTNTQHRKHWISGMHEPYLPNLSQREFFNAYFAQFQNLIPPSQDEITKRCRLQSPVHIRSLVECPQTDLTKLEQGRTVVVGGPPAIMSTAFESGITYINDGRRDPIAFGSALHLEWDQVSEAPSSSQPLHFIIDQLRRLLFPEFLEKAA